MKPLHVLVVDDSAVVRQAMSAVLSSEPGISVDVASDPLIAIDKMKKARPDVILLDLDMPRMDGLSFLQKLMAEDPVPVVICSGLTGDGATAMRALAAGAVAIVTKPQVGLKNFLTDSAVMLIDQIRGAAEAQVLRRGTSHCPAPLTLPPRTVRERVVSNRMIALGASTGGTEALQFILEAMPVDAPPIVIVQHMPRPFTGAFARRLDESCRIEVREGEHGMRLQPGLAVIARGDHHLSVRIDAGQAYACVTEGELVSRHRPSVDVLFEGLAQCLGLEVTAALLTGMGSDGARGLLELRRAGATTIAQNEATSVVFGMPKEAIRLGAAEHVLPLSQIPNALLRGESSKGASSAEQNEDR